ncbi:MAG: 30S ribosomal protein S17 [Candidatus Poribacteria bacterium]|nr:30S ribosomal protein S17 [Candidatus Poribacteria bacterium]MDE0504641.1 30S ribosomal protein S17 [Candidatus Poribacteria bacterium]
MTQEKQGHRKTQTGVVISNRMDKTVVVAITRAYQHPLYKKIVRHTTKVLAHDEQNACAAGDVVQVIESRPLSRRKKWRVRQITTKVESGEYKSS